MRSLQKDGNVPTNGHITLKLLFKKNTIVLTNQKLQLKHAYEHNGDVFEQLGNHFLIRDKSIGTNKLDYDQIELMNKQVDEKNK